MTMVFETGRPRVTVGPSGVVCSACRVVKPLDEFHRDRSHHTGRQRTCKDCVRQRQGRAEWHRAHNLKKKYSITVEQYEELFAAQDGKCAICGRAKYRNGVLDVDHNHETGKVRGLLCQDCNKGIGLFGDNSDNLQNAINYLKE